MSARPEDVTAVTLADIEVLAGQYATIRGRLYERMIELELEVDRLKRAALPAIREDVGAAITLRDQLHAAIDGARGLFVRPKTRTFHSIKVGLRKQIGEVTLDDEERVIKRIRETLKADQAELLIRVRESVDKNMVRELVPADLKALGIRIEDDSDVVVIKPQDGGVAKLVDALLASGDQLEEV